MEKQIYKTISDLWLLIKKYLPLAPNGSDEVWENLMSECNALLDKVKDQPQYYQDMTEKMVLGALDLLDGINKENRKND